MSNPTPGYSYWAQIRHTFWSHRTNRWAMRILFFLLFVAVFGDFIANEKPLLCRLEGGQLYSPILKEYGTNLGWTKGNTEDFQGDWANKNYDFVWFPLVPYSAGTIDRRNLGFTAPFGEQNLKSWRWRHWLGTDKIGRDVAAGMISGTRTALLVGLIAMSIAMLVGLFFGLLAGFYGDDGYKMYPLQPILMILALPIAVFYAFIVEQYGIGEKAISEYGLFRLLIFFSILFFIGLIGKWVSKAFGWQKRLLVPLDSLIMRLVEIINALPGLLLILAILAIVKTPSIYIVMVIIGLISWTSVTRFMRAEMLRIREMEYIQAARVLGFSDTRIIFRHALPNGVRPILITLSFGMAGAILIEAFLSFLGIGLPADTVTWGSMLQSIQDNLGSGAWWIGFFPGMAIFITVATFNFIGEGLTQALGKD